MDRTLQIWLIDISLALIASIFVQIFLMAIFIRLLSILCPKPGQRGIHEIADRALEAIENTDRAIKVTVNMLEEIRPVVNQAASVSRRQISHVDQVVVDALDGISRIQRDVSIVRNWPIREARGLSVGVISAMIAFFRGNGTANKGEKW
jgi:hypothetical protein